MIDQARKSINFDTIDIGINHYQKSGILQRNDIN